MSLAGFGYFAGGLTGGYLGGKGMQQAQARTDADVKLTTARSEGINNEVAAWKDFFAKHGPQFPTLQQSVQFSQQQPGQQQPASPMNTVPGLSRPSGPAMGLTPPYDPMRPTFGGY